jgi:hypothetical protein
MLVAARPHDAQVKMQGSQGILQLFAVDGQLNASRFLPVRLHDAVTELAAH